MTPAASPEGSHIPPSPSSARASGAARYQTIEALRGLAALAVVGYHSLDAYPTSTLAPLLRPVQTATGIGWMGVHVFFAISGWCIAERIAAAGSRGESAAHFLKERVLRIYPTYWCAVAATLAIRLLSAPFNHGTAGTMAPHGVVGWAAAIAMVEPYCGRAPYLLVSWTLTYEMGFYLTAAAALSGRNRRWIGTWALFLIGAAFCFTPWVMPQGSASGLFLGSWPDFFAGIAAWWAARRGHAGAGYALLLALVAACLIVPGYGASGRLSSVATGLVLALAFRADSKLASAPLMRPILWLGGISYSLYLIHVALMSPFENLAARWIPTGSTRFALCWMAAIGLAVAGGFLLNRWVERPVERWRKQCT